MILPDLLATGTYVDVIIDDKSFVIVDTGGFEPRTDDDVLAQMRSQTMVAVEEADIIVFMGDGQVGIYPFGQGNCENITEDRQKSVPCC